MNNSQKIDIVYSQTNYTKEKCRELLEKEEYDMLKVIRDYHNLLSETSDEKVSNNTSINQGIYNEIRKFMDAVDQREEKF